MIKLFIILILFVCASAENPYPDDPPIVSGCPTLQQSILPEHRLDLVKCDRDTLFEYIGKHKCCKVSHLGCDILVSAYLLVYPDAPYVCPKSS